MVDFARGDFFTKGALKFYHFLMNSTEAGAYTHVKKKKKIKAYKLYQINRLYRELLFNM